jgi:hypothetical protein
MPFDSTANLLFSISADASDAENNIQRFRTLLGTSLDDMKGQFSDWAGSVFGDLSTTEGAMTALAATAATVFIAAAAAAAALAKELYECAQQEAAYAEQVDQGMRITGLSAEQMSKLGYAAQQTGLSHEELNGALAKFATAIVAAESPTSKQAAAFRALGISQADVKAGETDLWPLLMKVADAFATHADNVNKSAIARDLFSRSGTNLLKTLDLGSAGFKTFADDAERLGHVLGKEDTDAAEGFTVELKTLRAEWEGLKLVIGRDVMPLVTGIVIEFEALAETVKKVSRDVHMGWEAFVPGASQLHATVDFFTSFNSEIDKAVARYKARVEALKQPPGPSLPPPTGGKDSGPDKAVEQTTENYRGFSDILERVKGQLAGATSEEAKIAAESEQLAYALQKATEQFIKLGQEGKLTPETVEREVRASSQAVSEIMALQQQRLTDLRTKRDQAEMAARQDLTQRLEAQQQDTYQHQVALWNDEINKLEARLAKEKTLSAANQTLIDQIRAAGLAKRERAASESFAKELNTLNRDLQQMLSAYLTSEQRIEQIYRQDMLTYSKAEEEKVKATVVGEAQRNVIHVQFEQLRHAALVRMQKDTQTLRNSQGWQGVFGNVFAQGLRSNETLMQQWAQSAHRDLLLVKVALEDLKEQAVETFRVMAQAEAQSIVHAFIYKQSIGEAMRQAAADTLEALASIAVKKAIFSAAEGFLDLACGDWGGAAAAFEAAGLYGLVGGGAALAARAIAPKQDASGGGAGAGSTDTGSAAAASSGSGSGAGSSGPNVTIYVSGHIIGNSGIDELTSMINDAVKGRDVRLIATQVKSPTRAVR